MSSNRVNAVAASDIFAHLTSVFSNDDFQSLMMQLNLPELISEDIREKLLELNKRFPLSVNIDCEAAQREGQEVATLAADYMRRRLADRVFYAIHALSIESLHYAMGQPISVSQLRALYDGVVTSVSTEQHDGSSVKKRGGDRRTQYEWTKDRYIAFSNKVDNLRELWNGIVNFFDDNDYIIECLHLIKTREFYKSYTKNNRKIPEGLLQRVLRRKREKGRNYWPFAFALQHARHEMGIEYAYSIDSLNKFYKEGKKFRQPSNSHS